MFVLRTLLLVSTIAIYLFTWTAVASSGLNWPAVAVNDLLALNWRSQFNFDFVVHLLLIATWIAWREGFTPKGNIFGILSIVMGGMFSFPYLFYASYVARGKPAQIVLGMRAGRTAE